MKLLIPLVILIIQINLIDAIRSDYQAIMMDESDGMKVITENSHVKKNKLSNTLSIENSQPNKEYFDQKQIFNYFSQNQLMNKVHSTSQSEDNDGEEQQEKEEEEENNLPSDKQEFSDEKEEKESKEDEKEKEKQKQQEEGDKKKEKGKEDEEEEQQQPKQKQQVIQIKDSENQIIQKEDGEIYFVRYDPVTQTTQMMNMSKIKEVDFKNSKLSIDNSMTDKPQIEKYSIPTYEPFEWYQVLSEGEIPQRRGGHSITVVGQNILLFGGCLLDNKCFNDLQFYDIMEKSWSSPKVFGEPPSARGGHSATLVGAYLYIYGGSNDRGIQSDLFRLNLENRVWEQFEYEGPKAPGRTNHKAILDNNGRIVFFGGYTEQGFSNDVFFLDLVNMRWVKPLINGDPPRPRENFSMNLIRDSYIWIFGGYALGGETNDLWQLDVDNMRWTRIFQSFGTKPVERQGHQMIMHGKLLYTLGGCNYKEQRCFNDLYQLSIDDLTWTKLNFVVENVFKERDNYGVSLMGSDLYVFGGCQMMEKCFNDFLVMNITDICPKNCSNRGTCRNNRCQCQDGFFGEQCEVEMKCEYNCSNRGICGTDGNCKCYRGFAGRICEIYVPCPSNCTSIENGLCENNGTCHCNPGYSGNACEVGDRGLFKIEIKCQNNCSKHGKCNEETGICICENGYGDIDCSLTIEEKEKREKQKKIEEEEEEKLKKQQEKDKEGQKAKKKGESEEKGESQEKVESKDPVESKEGESTQQDSDPTVKTETSPSPPELEEQRSHQSEIEGENNQNAAEQEVEKKQSEEDENNGEEQKEEGGEQEIVQEVSEGDISKSEEIAKLIHMSLRSQQDKQKIDSLSECDNNCSFSGICINKQCFCKPGVTGEDCSAYKISHLHKGIKATKLFFYIPIFFIIGVIIGYFYIKQKQVQKEEQEFGQIEKPDEEEKRLSTLALNQASALKQEQQKFIEDHDGPDSLIEEELMNSQDNSSFSSPSIRLPSSYKEENKPNIFQRNNSQNDGQSNNLQQNSEE